MKVFDCTTFYNENMMLELRFNILDPYVDKFVITESKYSHSGEKKKLNFDINKFKKFEDKIDYIVIDDLPRDIKNFKKGWDKSHIRDQFQRNSLEKGYKKFADEDLIMISDIDEIPDPKKISEFDINNIYACFLQRNFQSKINLLNVSDGYWAGTKICKKKFLKSPQWLRDIKTKKKPFWKFFKKNIQLINEGGWHFSFLKNPDSIIKKIKSYAHQEYNVSEFTDLNNIEHKISKGLDLFDRDIKYKKVEIDETFPDYIRENKQKLKEWIL